MDQSTYKVYSSRRVALAQKEFSFLLVVSSNVDTPSSYTLPVYVSSILFDCVPSIAIQENDSFPLGINIGISLVVSDMSLVVSGMSPVDYSALVNEGYISKQGSPMSSRVVIVPQYVTEPPSLKNIHLIQDRLKFGIVKLKVLLATTALLTTHPKNYKQLAKYPE